MQTLFAQARKLASGAGRLRRLTADHNWAAELARQGFIKEGEVRGSHWRHVVFNILGGGAAGVRVDVRKEESEPGDMVLLCSDGLTDMLNDNRIAAILSAEGEPESACRRLVDEANAAGARQHHRRRRRPPGSLLTAGSAARTRGGVWQIVRPAG